MPWRQAQVPCGGVRASPQAWGSPGASPQAWREPGALEPGPGPEPCKVSAAKPRAWFRTISQRSRLRLSPRQTFARFLSRVLPGSRPRMPQEISKLQERLCTTSRDNRPTMDSSLVSDFPKDLRDVSRQWPIIGHQTSPSQTSSAKTAVCSNIPGKIQGNSCEMPGNHPEITRNFPTHVSGNPPREILGRSPGENPGNSPEIAGTILQMVTI